MFYIYTLIAAVLLVAAQSFWKNASSSLGVSLSLKTLYSLIVTPSFLVGALLYVLATLIYIWLFSKYPYFSVQITLITFSVIFTLLVARLVFKEDLILINYLGVPLLVLGVVLATWKK